MSPWSCFPRPSLILQQRSPLLFIVRSWPAALYGIAIKSVDVLRVRHSSLQLLATTRSVLTTLCGASVLIWRHVPTARASQGVSALSASVMVVAQEYVVEGLTHCAAFPLPTSPCNPAFCSPPCNNLLHLYRQLASLLGISLDNTEFLPATWVEALKQAGDWQGCPMILGFGSLFLLYLLQVCPRSMWSCMRSRTNRLITLEPTVPFRDLCAPLSASVLRCLRA